MESLLSLLRKASIYGLGQGLSRLLSLLTLPVFTAYMTPAEFGVVTLLALFGTFLRIFFGMGTSAATGIVYFRSEEPGHRSTVIWTAITLASASAMAMTVVSGLFGEFIAVSYLAGVVSGTSVLLFAAATAFQVIAEPLLLRLQYQGRAAAYVAISSAGSVIGLGFSLALVAGAGLGPAGWVAGQVIGGLGLLAMAALWTLPGMKAPRIAGNAAAAVLRAGLPLVPGTAAILAMVSSAPWFVKELAGLEQTGRFGVGYQLGSGMALATGALSAAWYPFFLGHANRPGQGSEIFPGLSTLYVLGLGLVLVPVFALARPVLDVLVHPSYTSGWTIVGPVAATHVLIGLWGMLLPGMYFRAETAYVALVQIIAAMLTVALHLILIPRYGMDGAAGGLLGGASAMVALQLLFNRMRGYTVRVVDPLPMAGSLLLLALTCGLLWRATFVEAVMVTVLAVPVFLYAIVRTLGRLPPRTLWRHDD